MQHFRLSLGYNNKVPDLFPSLSLVLTQSTSPPALLSHNQSYNTIILCPKIISCDITDFTIFSIVHQKRGHEGIGYYSC